MEQSMQSVSKLVNPSSKDNLLSTWKKKSLNGNESIQEDIENENEKEKIINDLWRRGKYINQRKFQN